MPGWMKHKLESRLLGEISIISDMQMTPNLWQKSKKHSRDSMMVKEKSERAGVKLNIKKKKKKKNYYHGISPLTSWQIDGETMETETDFIFLDSKITEDSDCRHDIKNHLLLGRKAMRNLDSILKSRAISLPTMFHLVKVMVFPAVMYRCESWTLTKEGCAVVSHLVVSNSLWPHEL